MAVTHKTLNSVGVVPYQARVLVEFPIWRDVEYEVKGRR